jgi:hypothetical protein
LATWRPWPTPGMLAINKWSRQHPKAVAKVGDLATLANTRSLWQCLQLERGGICWVCGAWCGTGMFCAFIWESGARCVFVRTGCTSWVCSVHVHAVAVIDAGHTYSARGVKTPVHTRNRGGKAPVHACNRGVKHLCMHATEASKHLWMHATEAL